MLIEPTQEQIEKVCEFWVARLGKFNAFFQTSEERRDPKNRDVSYAEIEATVVGRKHAEEVATADAKERLRSSIRKYLSGRKFEIREDKEGRKYATSIFLSVDYHPEYDFFDVVKNAELDPHDFLFPLNTAVLIFSNGDVVAYEGICSKVRKL